MQVVVVLEGTRPYVRTLKYHIAWFYTCNFDLVVVGRELDICICQTFKHLEECP